MKNELEPENNILELQTKIIECKKSESHTKHEINISAKFTATASLYYKNQKYGFIYLKINQSSDITKIIGEASFEIRNDNTKKSLQYGPEQSSHSHLFLLCIQKYERKDDKIYHGVGTALMEALFRTSIDLGLGGRLRLVTGRGSEPFHYRLGFRPEADFETYACDLATNQYTKTCSTFFYLPQKAIQEYWAIFEHHNQSLESLPTESFENSKKIRKMMLITDHTKKKTLFGHLLLALHQDQYLLTDSASISEKKIIAQTKSLIIEKTMSVYEDSYPCLLDIKLIENQDCNKPDLSLVDELQKTYFVILSGMLILLMNDKIEDFEDLDTENCLEKIGKSALNQEESIDSNKFESLCPHLYQDEKIQELLKKYHPRFISHSSLQLK